MNLLSHRPVFCTVCKKQITHKHKPKKEWQIEGRLCGDCYVNEMQKFYEQSLRQKCVACGIEKDVPDLWEPRSLWEMKGLLCKSCFSKKDEEHKNLREFCRICGKKLGLIRYNPKKNWSMKGQLCRECWDSQKAKLG